jgi:hypothetical protein
MTKVFVSSYGRDSVPGSRSSGRSSAMPATPSSETSSATGTGRALTPSVTVSRPLSPNSPAPPGQWEVAGNAARPSRASSSLAMPEISAAIDNVARGLDRPANEPSAEPETTRLQSPSAAAASAGQRRRSSSRIHLAAHDVKDEDPPQDRFHDPAVQNAMRDAKSLMSVMKNVLESSALHEDVDSTMHRLHRRARGLSSFKLPSTRTVGFVGDSGVGM